jgi:hypothetical protein
MRAYAYRAAMHCEDCGENYRDACLSQGILDNGDTDTFPQGPLPYGGGEADCPQHCDTCGVFLGNALTADGLAYVREALRVPVGNPEVLALWADFYSLECRD